MPCPYCQSTVRGFHTKACREMRAIERIDIIVGDLRYFGHTRALLHGIFTKQNLPRKPKP